MGIEIFETVATQFSSCKESPQIVVLEGAQINPYLTEIVELMLIVYREAPYRYEGTMEEYLPLVQAYANSKHGIAALLFDGRKLIGVAAGAPLTDVNPKWHEPFKNDGIEKIFYVGDEVLLSERRGQGFGSRLFDTLVRAIPAPYEMVAFSRIEEESPLNNALKARGFVERPEKNVVIPWREIGPNEEAVPHKLVFWTGSK